MSPSGLKILLKLFYLRQASALCRNPLVPKLHVNVLLTSDSRVVDRLHHVFQPNEDVKEILVESQIHGSQLSDLFHGVISLLNVLPHDRDGEQSTGLLSYTRAKVGHFSICQMVVSLFLDELCDGDLVEEFPKTLPVILLPFCQLDSGSQLL